MDISGLSIQELEELQARIPAEIAKRKAGEKEQLLSELASLASKHGYSLDELVGGKRAAPAEAKGKRTRKAAAVKYRHPNNGELTWSGRGLKPRWVNEWLGQGNSLDALKV